MFSDSMTSVREYDKIAELWAAEDTPVRTIAAGSLVKLIALVLLLYATTAPRTHAASIAVQPGVPDNAANNGNCSLREAVFAAMLNVARDACAAGSSVATDTILLEAGREYVLTLSGAEDGNLSGDIDFTSTDIADPAIVDLIIRSDGDLPATIIQQAGGERVFHNAGGLYVRFENVVIQGGTGGLGAGVRLSSGKAEFERVTFSGNSAEDISANGGALWVADTASAAVLNSTFINNTSSTGYGGAIFTFSPLIVANSTFSANGAFSGGGALASYNTSVEIVNSTFAGSTTAVATPSGIDIEGLQNSILTVNNSTFAGGNTLAGASILVRSGSSASVTNSIIAPADPGDAACLAVDDAGDATITGSYNRVHVSGSDCDGPGSTILSANSLSPLGDYGGSAQTIMLRPGSNALNGGSPATCAASDARGVPRRIAEGLCDIGAVEMYHLTLSAPPTATEADTVNYTLSINPAVPVGQTLAVFVSTQQASAAAGTDYTETAQNLTFDSANSARVFSVTHLHDDVDEPDEYYGINLYQITGLALPEAPYMGVISDDDSAGVTVSPNRTFSVTEGGAAVIRAVALTSRPLASVSVTLTYQGEDLSFNPSRATFQFTIAPEDWDTPVSINIAAVPDVYDEGSETETVTLSIESADPLYDGAALAPISVMVIDADSTLLVNGGFEQDGNGGANPANKKALGWTVSPLTSNKNRRECLPSGDTSPCAWLFKGSSVAQSIKQTLSLPAYTVGDMLVMSGKMRRSNIAAGVVAKLQILFSDGQKDSAKFKFAAGTDALYNTFTRQLALNVPLTDISSVTLTLSSSAATGKIYFDDIQVRLTPRVPRGGFALPPPPPTGFRRGQ